MTVTSHFDPSFPIPHLIKQNNRRIDAIKSAPFTPIPGSLSFVWGTFLLLGWPALEISSIITVFLFFLIFCEYKNVDAQAAIVRYIEWYRQLFFCYSGVDIGSHWTDRGWLGKRDVVKGYGMKGKRSIVSRAIVSALAMIASV